MQPIYHGYSTKHLFAHLLLLYEHQSSFYSTLFLQFYKSNYKHPWYNLEIKEADQVIPQLVASILTN